MLFRRLTTVPGPPDETTPNVVTGAVAAIAVLTIVVVGPAPLCGSILMPRLALRERSIVQLVMLLVVAKDGLLSIAVATPATTQLVMDGPGGAATAAGQVPVYEVGQDLEQYLSAEQPALGPELIELLRQQGYEVQHQQQYFPAPLNDGRQIIVPVDGYRITPVSRRF